MKIIVNILIKKKKLRVIFRGINIDYYNQKNISILKQEKLKQEWGLSSNKFTILMPGRLTYWKGQEKFIESLNILVEDYNYTNFQAIILGPSQGRKVYAKNAVKVEYAVTAESRELLKIVKQFTSWSEQNWKQLSKNNQFHDSKL